MRHQNDADAKSFVPTVPVVGFYLAILVAARRLPCALGVEEPGQIQMDIAEFMRGYKTAWEARDESRFCALFTTNGIYRNTPFAEQRGHEQLAKYWQRVKLQADINVVYEILASTSSGGLAHWHVTYQVTSEELFQIWAASAATNVVTRKPGDPLPRMALDGILQAEFDGGLCSQCRIWWHSMVVVQQAARNADT